MALTLEVVAEGRTEKDEALTAGMIVEYLGHLPGGNVSIRRKDGEKDTANPLCFKELR